MVPPVPTPAMKISTFPSVSLQISGPVPALWAAGFAGFTNCPGMKLPGISFASSRAFSIAPFIPFAPSVSTSSAPYAFKIFLRSALIVSGMVSMIRYPFAAAMDASPIPVFPDVGSIITDPSFKSPLLSASSSIAFAILSFTLPAGLKYSSFSRTVALSPSSFSIFTISTRGVLPINPRAP